MFINRQDAGRQLVEPIRRFAGAAPVVLALPRGGVVVGFEIASALPAPLDLVLVRKIGAPWHPELAVAAVVDGPSPVLVVNDDIVRALGLPEDYLLRERDRQLGEIERRRAVYLAGRPRVEVAGRTAIVVDDGLATGATARAALKAIRQMRPARIILAVPVAPPDTLAMLEEECDQIVCPTVPDHFTAIGAFYGDFTQVEDAEVVDLLDRARLFRAPCSCHTEAGEG